MKVELISHTPEALSLLLKTKGTRLKHDSDPATWTDEQRAEHLAYMKDTIKSSWEFVDYVFRIEGVTRAFTHQLVRTRTGSYAQESQRTVDVRDHEVVAPDFSGLPQDQDLVEAYWDEAVIKIKDTYASLMEHGVPAQDARGILPTNITTSIIAKFNLRTLHEMAKLRLCTRTQGEYQRVFREMRARVIEIHPWVGEHDFLEVHCAANGTCAFPRYGKTSCGLYHPAMDLDWLKKQVKRQYWSAAPQVAVPVAKDGRTM